MFKELRNNFSNKLNKELDLSSRRPRKAEAGIEYVVLITIILAALITFQTYIIRGMNAKWKAAGDVYDHGRQYFPNLTVECAYDFVHTKSWYEYPCFFALNCDCVSIHSSNKTCRECIGNCAVNCASFN